VRRRDDAARAGVGQTLTIATSNDGVSDFAIGRSPVRLVDMKEEVPASVVARHSKFDVLGSMTYHRRSGRRAKCPRLERSAGSTYLRELAAYDSAGNVCQRVEAGSAAFFPQEVIMRMSPAWLVTVPENELQNREISAFLDIVTARGKSIQ
jgi:hypothetical protein